MQTLESGLVDIIRDFLAVHESATEVVRRHREGSLRFDDVQVWVGDDGQSELFRLKENCHSIFRPVDSGEVAEIRVGALLDLAVGSLFHEAMKLRENLYQLERYGPRVRALRGESDPQSVELFSEFEKLLAASAVTLDGSVTEVEVMLVQTRQQLLRLIVEHGQTGLAARCLYEAGTGVTAVCPDGLDALYAKIHGKAVTGYVIAADSYLESAYYGEALATLAEARRRSPGNGEVGRTIDYAEGMQAFFSRDYEKSIERLSEWLDAGTEVDDPQRIRLALAGTQHVERLPVGGAPPDVIRRAAELSEQIRIVQKR
jgi:hypothetical protein